MTYTVAANLQEAVFTRLAADAALGALVDGAIYDALPGGVAPPLYVALGPEDVRARGDGTAFRSEHDAGSKTRLFINLLNKCSIP